MKDKDFLKLLIQDGWVLKNVEGSHHKLEKDNEIVIVAIHGKDIKKGLWNSQIKKLLKFYGLI